MPVIRVATASYIVDLGVILAADCTGGNSVDLQPLIDAPVGAMVQLLVANTDFVQHDSDGFIEIYLYGGSASMLAWANNVTIPADVVSYNPSYALQTAAYIEDGQPFLFVGAGSLATVGSIHLKALVVEAGY